jgi:hypothetical protein
MNEAPEMPRFGVIQAALRKTTERLALELHSPSAGAPEWNDFEWQVASAVATMHGISALLANRLRWHGPAPWREFLDVQHARSVERDAVIGELISRVDDALRAEATAAVGLKGTAVRRLGLHRPGERPMADLDLLVDAAALPGIAAAMQRIDYVHAFTSRRHAVYEPRQKPGPLAFGEHPAHPIKIEVHSAIAEPLPFRRVDITERLAAPVAAVGLVDYPDAAALVSHLLLHAAGNMRAHALRLVQLVDIARLAPQMSRDQWRAIGAWWAYPPLRLTSRCFPGSVPPELLDMTARLCSVPLRRAAERWRLVDVSWSNLRVHALPGIWWARTPFEAARFALSRAWPSRQAIDELALAMRAQPQLASTPWYTLSHPHRILRWLVSRPPRVQTLTCVRGAVLAGQSGR